VRARCPRRRCPPRRTRQTGRRRVRAREGFGGLS
jgi:hypothetical protein